MREGGGDVTSSKLIFTEFSFHLDAAHFFQFSACKSLLHCPLRIVSDLFKILSGRAQFTNCGVKRTSNRSGAGRLLVI